MLTRKQHELLTYVNKRLKADGVSPSFDEMKDALGLRMTAADCLVIRAPHAPSAKQGERVRFVRL